MCSPDNPDLGKADFGLFNLFVRNRMVWLEAICGATVFDYVFQCLIHDFLPSLLGV
jgi:hypothetical protein